MFYYAKGFIRLKLPQKGSVSEDKPFFILVHNIHQHQETFMIRQLPEEKQNELMGRKQHFAEAAGVEIK